MQASSEGVVDPRSRTALWVAAGGRFGVRLAGKDDTGLQLRGDVVGDLSPLTLEVNHWPAWSAPTVAASLGADITVRF